jgi:hypothetical protein
MVIVKRLFIIALAASLAACETMYPPDPYGYPGDPYGYPPYPVEPYPPYPPYPPTDPYPPGQAYPPAMPYPPLHPAACPITSSGDWRAWINRMPGGSAQPYLFVSGRVTTPTGGYQVVMERDLRIAESYPAQAFATVRATPPAGSATQVLVTHNVHGQWPLGQPIGSLVIRCGDRTLAQITPVQNTR